MMLYKSKMMDELMVQESIEGATEDTRLVRKFLEIAERTSQVRALLDCDLYRYGPLSYESHRFWRPSKLLKKLMS